MTCDIDGKYQLLGGVGSFLGAATDVRHQTPDGLGFYRHYEHGSIYCRDTFGLEPVVIYGLIRQRWSQMGWERSPLGFPVTDELAVGSGGGRVSFFERGGILYRPDIGTFEIHGSIFRRWREIGGVNGVGFPLTDESSTPDGRGRYNHFERGSIYWTPERGAWEVTADIKNAWASTGWERGPVGYPVDGPRRMPGVSTDFQDFERGTIYAFGPNTKFYAPAGNSVFSTSERFITWSDFARRLPDGDIISATHTSTFPQFGIAFTLIAGPAITWWKAISLFTPGRGDFQEVSVDGARRTATMKIPPDAFDAGNVYLHFKKAKTLGIHTGMYYLVRPDRMIGTNTTFTWIADQ